MSKPFKYILKFKQALIAAMISLSVMSCGGSSIVSAGISGTGIVFGAITGFGSIFVNGVRYDIDNASLNVDGNAAASQSDLGLGMVVKLNIDYYDDGTSEVSSVSYDDAVEGPVALVDPDPLDATIKRLQIFDLTVIIDDNMTSFKDTSFDTVAEDDVLEVSGFINQDGDIVATRVEKEGILIPGTTEVELRGVISGLDTGMELFILNGTTTIHYDDVTTEFEDLDGGLADGLNIEVTGVYENNGSITANKIEGEDDDLSEIEDSSGEVSLHGLITTFVSTTEFEVNGIPVEVDTSKVPASIYDQLELGLEVEVEGIIDNAVLIADEIELRDGDLEYQALIKSVNPTARTIGVGFPGIAGEITLQVDNISQLEDETTDTAITIDQLATDDEVKVEALLDETSNKIVVSLKRLAIEKYAITDTVSSYIPGTSVTIDGLVLPLEGDAATTDLSGIVLNETVVELQDEELDGFFETIEF